MNKDQLKKVIGHRVRVRPIAKRLSGAVELPGIDDVWRVDTVSDSRVQLSNLRTGHVATLGLDHIHSYLSDPGGDVDAIRSGFLQLRVLVSLRDQAVEIEPLPPGDWGQGASVREEGSRQGPSHEEPMRFSTLNDAELKRVMTHFKELGEEPCLPLFEDRDSKLLSGFRIAYYPGTDREIWAGHHRGRYEHLLMLKPCGRQP